MDPAELPELSTLLSPTRLAPYLAAVGGARPAAVRLYTWNVEVSAAFWGPLHALEVGLRNRLNDRMAARYGSGAWWDEGQVRLHQVMASQLAAAKLEAAAAAGRRARPVVAGDVVAALSFGFWVGLLGTGKDLNYETRYWQPFLHLAFPGYTGTRRDVHQQFNHLRLFRNRIAHHEPIFRRHLAADHDAILRAADELGADAATYIRTHSRVPASLARRATCVQEGRLTSF